MSGTVRLGNLIEKAHVKYREFECDDDLEAFGVSNTEGITRTAHRKSEDLGEYLVLEPGSFAYNPYRINVGSIGLTPANVTGLVSPAYVVFRVKKRELIPEVLLDFLKSSEGLRQINKLARGAVRKALRFEDLCEIEFPVISFERQLEILKHKQGFNVKHGSLLSELTHQQSLLAKLKQAILQEAIQGKLTANWRAAHPDMEAASHLLQRIQAEKARLIAAKKLRPEKPLPQITPAEIPFEIPEGWEWCRYGDLCEYVTSGSRGWQQFYSDSGALFIRAQNIKTDKLLLDDKAFVDLPNKAEGTRARVLRHDILITITGGNLAKTAVVEDDFEEAYVSQHIALTRLVDTGLSTWIHMALTTDNGPRGTLLGYSRGDKPGLNLPNIRSVPIPLPPLAEQAAILERVEALMTTCRALEAEIEHARTHAAQLLQAVLKEAFAPAL
jgi:type I restriction enzyme S subunit